VKYQLRILAKGLRELNGFPRFSGSHFCGKRTIERTLSGTLHGACLLKHCLSVGCIRFGSLAMYCCRTGKSPLIFGAKTDREMREWMMAIKLLAEKLTTTTPTVTAAAAANHNSRQQQQQQQLLHPHHLLHASRRNDVTRRSSPQLPSIADSRWSTGKFCIIIVVFIIVIIIIISFLSGACSLSHTHYIHKTKTTLIG